MGVESRIYAEVALLEEVKENYPETTRMTYTGVVDWALRKLVQIKQGA